MGRHHGTKARGVGAQGVGTNAERTQRTHKRNSHLRQHQRCLEALAAAVRDGPAVVPGGEGPGTLADVAVVLRQRLLCLLHHLRSAAAAAAAATRVALQAQASPGRWASWLALLHGSLAAARQVPLLLAVLAPSSTQPSSYSPTHLRLLKVLVGPLEAARELSRHPSGGDGLCPNSSVKAGQGRSHWVHVDWQGRTGRVCMHVTGRAGHASGQVCKSPAGEGATAPSWPRRHSPVPPAPRMLCPTAGCRCSPASSCRPLPPTGSQAACGDGQGVCMCGGWVGGCGCWVGSTSTGDGSQSLPSARSHSWHPPPPPQPTATTISTTTTPARQARPLLPLPRTWAGGA